jgi:hypothetical protein
LLLPACAEPTEEDETQDPAQIEQSVAALSISGEWAVVRWQGQITTTQGSIATEHPVDLRADAADRMGAVFFDLDAEGNGTLKAMERCRPADVLPSAGGLASPGSRSAALVSGAFGLIAAFVKLAEVAVCDPARPKSKQLQVFRRSDFWGRATLQLPANVGVYGESAGVRAADAECRGLRGVRWLSIGDGGAACIGYADAGARTLKLMLQRPGDIYVQRMVLRRPGSQ